MYIGIDIHSVVGSDGKAVAYCPFVHWSIDETDASIDLGEMHLLSKKLSDVIQDGINRAMKKSMESKIK